MPNTLAGPTFLAIMGEQFKRSRSGDRFWFETSNPDLAFTIGETKFLLFRYKLLLLLLFFYFSFYFCFFFSRTTPRDSQSHYSQVTVRQRRQHSTHADESLRASVQLVSIIIIRFSSLNKKTKKRWRCESTKRNFSLFHFCRNPLVNCNEIPSVDLTLWKDIRSPSSMRHPLWPIPKLSPWG